MMTNLFRITFLMFTLSLASCALIEKDSTALNIDSTLNLAVFISPEAASNAFVLTLKNKNTASLTAILGKNYSTVLPTEDLSHEDITRFINAWDTKHKLISQGQNKKLLQVGEQHWTFPIPITLGVNGWYFDIHEGLERIRIRRIGRNEVNVMQAVLAYYDAQMEYFEKDHTNNKTLEYAQKFISSPTKHDGLYWETQADETLSPLGPLFSESNVQQQGYYGYSYKILKAQGDNAKGGAHSYLLDGNMIKGFALIAWPKEYGETGIMTFIVSHAGIIYEQNLGTQTSQQVKEISIYDPGTDWIPSRETYTP